MDLKEAFKIRKKDAETDEVIITIGNHLATEQVFKSEAPNGDSRAASNYRPKRDQQPTSGADRRCLS